MGQTRKILDGLTKMLDAAGLYDAVDPAVVGGGGEDDCTSIAGRRPGTVPKARHEQEGQAGGKPLWVVFEEEEKKNQ